MRSWHEQQLSAPSLIQDRKTFRTDHQGPIWKRPVEMACSAVAMLVLTLWTGVQLAWYRSLQMWFWVEILCCRSLPSKSKNVCDDLTRMWSHPQCSHCFPVIHYRLLFSWFWVIEIPSIFLYGTNNLNHFLKPECCYCRFVTGILKWLQGLTHLCWVGSLWCYAQKDKI